MADPKVSVKLSSDNSGLFSGLKEATAGIKSFGKDIEGHFSSLTKSIGNIKAPFLAITAGFAAIGGAVAGIKKAIDSTVNWTMEVNKLHNVMGISLKDASAWRTTLERMGIDMDSFTGVLGKLQIAVAKHPELFEKWGIAIKDTASGAMLPMSDVIMNLASKYASLGNQSDRNIMLADLTKKGYQALIPVMRITADQIQKSTEINDAFGLSVDANGVAKARAYKETMATLDIAFKGTANVIGQAVMPMVEQLAKSFGGVLQDILPVLSFSFKTLSTVLVGAGYVVKLVAIAFQGAWEQTKIGVLTAIDVISLAIHGKFSQAMERANQGADEMYKSAKSSLDKMVKATTDAGASIKSIWTDSKPTTEETPDKAKLPGLPLTAAQLMERLKGQLEQLRQAKANELGVDADFYQLSKAEENKFWNDKAAAYKGKAEYLKGINQEINASRKAMGTEAIEKEKAILDKSLSDARNNYDLQRAAAIKYQEFIKSKFGEQSKEYDDACKKIREIDNKHQEMMNQIDVKGTENYRKITMLGFDVEEARLKQHLTRGEITGTEFLVKQQEIEDRRYAIKLQSADDIIKLAIEEGNALKIAEAQQARELIETEQVKAIALHGILMKEAKLNEFKDLTGAFQNSVSSSLTNMLTGQEKGIKALQSLYKSLTQTIVKHYTDILAQKMTNWLVDKTISAWTKTDTTTHVEQNAVKQTSDTATASTGFFSSFASMGPWGYALAVAAIVAMFAFLGSATGRAKGGLVDSPQLTMLGEGGEPELVIPESGFREYANQMYRDIQATNGRMNAYANGVSSYSGAPSQSSGQADQAITVVHQNDFSGSYFVGTDQANMDAVARQFNKINTYYKQSYS